MRVIMFVILTKMLLIKENKANGFILMMRKLRLLRLLHLEKGICISSLRNEILWQKNLNDILKKKEKLTIKI